jgi:hypothetical protein
MLEILSILNKGEHHEEKVQSSGDRREVAEMLG